MATFWYVVKGPYTLIFDRRVFTVWTVHFRADLLNTSVNREPQVKYTVLNENIRSSKIYGPQTLKI